MPSKRCTKCGQEFPATTEFFSRDSYRSDGLTSHCKACRRANTQKWRDENPDKVEAYNKDYYWSHREQELGRNQHFHQINKKQVSTRKRRDYERKADYFREFSKQYRKDHPVSVALQAERRQKRLRDLPYTLTDEEWKEVISYWKKCCVYCGGETESLTIEHYIPANNPNCPGTILTNVLPACFSCNASKKDVDISEWLETKFGDLQATIILEKITTYFASLSNDKG